MQMITFNDVVKFIEYEKSRYRYENRFGSKNPDVVHLGIAQMDAVNRYISENNPFETAEKALICGLKIKQSSAVDMVLVEKEGK